MAWRGTACGMAWPDTSDAVFGTYVLLGASLGGLIAHLVMLSATLRGVAPMSVVLIDPAPLFWLSRDLRPPGVRGASAYLALHTVGSDAGLLDEVDHTDHSASQFERVATHLLDLAANFQARADDDDEASFSSIWVVLASEREDEFAGADLSLQQAGPAAARLMIRKNTIRPVNVRQWWLLVIFILN